MRFWRTYFSELLIPLLTRNAYFYGAVHLPCGDDNADLLAGEAFCDDWRGLFR